MQGDERSGEFRSYQFGDALDRISMTESLKNAQINHGLDEFYLTENDLVVEETMFKAQLCTVFMIDISHIMILYGEDRFTPAKKVALGVEQMHRTALALRAPGCLAEQLRHDHPGRHAPRQRVAVVAVRRGDVVVVTQGCHGSDRNGLLPDIEMTKTADVAYGIGLAGFFFEAPNQQHSVQQLSVKIRTRGIEPCVRLNLRHAVFRAELHWCCPLRLLPGMVR